MERKKVCFINIAKTNEYLCEKTKTDVMPISLIQKIEFEKRHKPKCKTLNLKIFRKKI